MNKNNLFKYLLSIFVSSLVLFYLFRGINISEFKNSFSLDFKILILSLIIFFFIKLINTYRFSKMYELPMSINLFHIMSYSNMLLSIFPFRLGEISYISELQKITKKNYSAITSSLIKIRFYDYLSIYFFLMISSLYVYSTFSNIVKLISLFFMISLILIILVFVLIIKLKLSDKIKFKKISVFFKLIESEINNHSKIKFLKEFKMILLSLFYWLSRLLMGFLILNLLNINLSFFTISFISLSVFMLSIVPIQFFAGFGITEAGFIFFLTKLGFEYNKTLIILLNYHIYSIIPIFIYGLISFIMLKLTKRYAFIM